MVRNIEYKAFTDAAFMPNDSWTEVVPLRAVELVEYEMDSDKITVDFCGTEYEIPLDRVYREAKRKGKGSRPKRIFKTILRKIADKQPLESIIGV